MALDALLSPPLFVCCNNVDKVKAIKEKMSTLSITFSKNCNDVDTKFHFTAAELDGLSASDLSRLTKLDDGTYEVPLDYFPYFPCLDYVKVEETRKVLERVSNAQQRWCWCSRVGVRALVLALEATHI